MFSPESVLPVVMDGFKGARTPTFDEERASDIREILFRENASHKRVSEGIVFKGLVLNIPTRSHLVGLGSSLLSEWMREWTDGHHLEGKNWIQRRARPQSWQLVLPGLDEFQTLSCCGRPGRPSYC